MNSKDPSFSICIPNYNYARYVGETIQSVLDQTYQNFEIIVADNASTDNSVEVVESFKDPRIRLIRNRYNIGFGPNLQRTTMHASNDFINLLSSDDLMRPHALETYADVLAERGEQARHTVLMSDAEIVDSQSQTIGYIRRAPNSFETISWYGDDHPPSEAAAGPCLNRGLDVLRSSLGQLRNFAPFLTVVYPRTLGERVEGYNSVRTIGPDKHFHYKLLAQDPDVVYVRSALYRYRMHSSPNQQAQLTSLKQQIDDYLHTLEHPDDLLATLGLTRHDLIRSLLDRVCLKAGLTQLANGSYLHALRLLAFALAAYPKETLRRPRSYMLAGLLALGPLARFVARPFYSLYHRRELRRLADGIP
ncbi:MAG: glycosyltransferase [Anaerolineales bacterium]